MLNSTFFAIIGKDEVEHQVERIEAPSQLLASKEAMQKAKSIGAGLVAIYTEPDAEEMLQEIKQLSNAHKGTMIYGLAPNGTRFENGNFWSEWQQEEKIFFYGEVINLLCSAKDAGLESAA
jgi:hypothetical protein